MTDRTALAEALHEEPVDGAPCYCTAFPGVHEESADRLIKRLAERGYVIRPATDEGLDVERLARVLNTIEHADECLGWDNPKAGCRGFYRRKAKRVAREYARLGGPR